MLLFFKRRYIFVDLSYRKPLFCRWIDILPTPLFRLGWAQPPKLSRGVSITVIICTFSVLIIPQHSAVGSRYPVGLGGFLRCIKGNYYYHYTFGVSSLSLDLWIFYFIESDKQPILFAEGVFWFIVISRLIVIFMFVVMARRWIENWYWNILLEIFKRWVKIWRSYFMFMNSCRTFYAKILLK